MEKSVFYKCSYLQTQKALIRRRAERAASDQSLFLFSLNKFSWTTSHIIHIPPTFLCYLHLNDSNITAFDC